MPIDIDTLRRRSRQAFMGEGFYNSYNLNSNDKLQIEKKNKPNIGSSIEIEILKSSTKLLRSEIKKLKNENEELKSTLNRSREINKRILLILYDHGIMKEGSSIFSLFREVKNIII